MARETSSHPPQGAEPTPPAATDRSGEIFPRAVQPRVFRMLWLVLAVLLVALTLVGLRYAQIAQS